MRRLLSVGALATAMAIGSPAWAEDEEASSEGTEASAEASADTADIHVGGLTDGVGASHPMVVGAFMSMGAALTIGDLNFGEDQKPRFAGSGGAFFNYYFTPIFAIEAGLGFIGKGFIIKYEAEGVDIKLRQTFINLEIPLGVKLNIKNIQLSAAIAIDFVISGKFRTTEKLENDTSKNTHTMDGSDWDTVRRFNIGPKVGAGYAIALGPVYLVPGVSWSMDLINYAKEEAAELGGTARGMNVMVVVAGEFGFGGAAE